MVVVVNSNKLFFLAFLSIIAFSLLFGCASTVPSSSNDSLKTVSFSLSVYDDSNSLIFSSVADVNAGMNAFDAMKLVLSNTKTGLNSNLEFEQYPFGIMVTSIAGKKAPSTHYWALYVNGAYASKGISDYFIDSDANFVWRLEKIESFGS